MFPLVVLADVRLAAKSRPINLEWKAGESWAVMGPGELDSLFEAVSKSKRPFAGSVNLGGHVVETEGATRWRKSLMEYAKSMPRGGDLEAVAEALAVLQLWDHRRTVVDRLDPWALSQVALLPLLLAAPSSILLCQSGMDGLDPWLLPAVMESLGRRTADQCLLVVKTSRPDIAEHLGRLVVFHRQEVAFSGSVEELIAKSGPELVTLRSREEPVARALVEPFQVDASSTSEGEIHIRSQEQQHLAAHLLTQGYGNTSLVWHRPRTLEEALLALPLI